MSATAFYELHYPGDQRDALVPMLVLDETTGAHRPELVPIDGPLPWVDGLRRQLRVLQIEYDETADRSTVHLTAGPPAPVGAS